MASRFVAAVALFAVCQSSPVQNGFEYRGPRTYTGGEGSSISYGGTNKAYTIVSDGKVQAEATNDNAGNIARDAFGNALPAQAYVKAGTFDTPYESAGIRHVQPAYYPVPAPATVVAYQQYADIPAETPSQFTYGAPTVAQSSATVDGIHGTAASNANTHGAGYGSASSIAKTTSGGTPIATADDLNSAVVAAKTQGAYNPAYTPVGYGSASSNANVNGHSGSASSSAKTGVPARKSISWRFGTAYDNPADYIRVAPRNNYGSASALSTANTNAAGLGSVNTVANSYGGQAGATAVANNADYATRRSGEGYNHGSVKSSANSNGYGYAKSNAVVNNAAYGVRSAGGSGNTLAADAHSRGSGNAVSSAKSHGLSADYSVVNSAANSYGPGSNAGANAYSI